MFAIFSILNIQYEISISKFNFNYHSSLNNSPHFTHYVVHLAPQVEYISARLCLSVCSAV